MYGMLGWLACAGGGSGGAEPSGPVVVEAKGSDTMVNLVQRLSESYSATTPGVVVSVTGGGSGTGIKALIDGTTDMATSSREMKEKETTLAKEKGRNPVRTIVAQDGLSMYVHKDNPVERLSFTQLACIYGAEGTCKRWSDVGVTLDCGGTDEIVVLSRQNNSGTYEYFREVVLSNEGRFTTTLDQSGTQQVVDVVATSLCAVGYGGIGYAHAGARAVCLSKADGEPCVVPSVDTVKSGAYAFGRPLQVYTDGPPQGAVKQFLDWVTSPAGQAVVVEAGFVTR
jgi:phosphate transport system substrate-binding protein